jgi:hypothetical protein
MKKIKLYGISLFAVVWLAAGCKNISDIKAFTEARYSLRDISEVRVNSVLVSNKSRLEEFRMNEIATLLSAYNNNDMEADAMVGLQVDLPEGKKSEITVTKLKWQLLVDDKETLSGVVEEPVKLQAGLNTFPIRTPVMVTETDGQRNFDGLMQLMALLSRKGEDRGNVVLQIKPTVLTSVGNVESPRFIPLNRPKS